MNTFNTFSTMLIQMISSFIAVIGFGILTNIPPRILKFSAFAGMVGWTIYWCCLQIETDVIFATFLGAFAVSLIASFLAKYCKMPITIFNIPGIFPLVPGITAFQSFKSFIDGNFNTSMSLLLKTFVLSFSIALAIILAELINRIIRHKISPR